MIASLMLMLAGGCLSAPAQAETASHPKWQHREELARQAAKELLAPWSKAWKAKDAPAYAALFEDRAAVPAWSAAQTLARERGGIQEWSWPSVAPSDKTREALTADAASYLGRFSAVDDVALDVLDASGTSDKGALTVRLDVRGRLSAGGRRVDRGVLELAFSRGKSGLLIKGIKAAGLETLTAKQAAFEDVTASVGLDRVPMAARAEAIRRGGYALAVGDFAGSGRAGVYVGGSGPGRLYEALPDGKFKDATKEAGLGEDTLVKSALFADLDNSGRLSLVLQRFVDDSKQELVFYRNMGKGRFERADVKLARKRKHDRPMSMAAGDFNGDGLIDLYVGYPGTRDFTDDRMSPDKDVAREAVYLNQGKWKFEETEGLPAVTAQVVRPHSAIATDVNADGRADLVVIDDRGSASRLYQNAGSARFNPVDSKAGLENQAWGMTAALGDFTGEGQDGVYFSNIDLSAGRRVLKFAEDDGLKSGENVAAYTRLKTLLRGNRLYRHGEADAGPFSYKEITEKAGVGYAGEAPAGAAWVDYDNDGLLDLYVTNGLWSADPERDYAAEFVSRQLMSKDSLEEGGEDNAVMKMLQKDGGSFAGYQRNRLFRNNGDGTFTEVGYLAGADRLEDGYVAAVADLDGNGAPDLVLRNADPPSLARPYSPVTVLRNRGGANKSLVVTLKAKAGASGDIGARVTVRTGGRTQSRELLAVQGSVQSEQAAFFGLEKAERADELEVRWPSGTIDRYRGVKAGRVVLKEGAGEVTSAGQPAKTLR